jgi:histone H3/H4
MTLPAEVGTWKHCNMCKSPIAFQAEYFVCSVSTCNRKRTGLNFCSLPCFEAHLPTARHRDAWAESARAPSESEWKAALAAEAPTPGPAAAAARSASSGQAGRSPEPRPATAAPPPTGEGPTDEHEVLVVVSKLKKYVRDWSGMSTSDAAMNVLSDHLRELCREATRQAGADGRRTVLDRDFAKVVAERRGPDVKRRF